MGRCVVMCLLDSHHYFRCDVCDVCVGVLLVFLFGIECYAAIIEFIFYINTDVYISHMYIICLYTRVYIYVLFD